MVRQSPLFFAVEFLRGPPNPPYNGRFLAGPHHFQWDALIKNHDRLCVLAPRDHGKTFFFDLAVPLWRVACEPSGVGMIFSATRDQASRILLDILMEVESNPRLQWLVPERKVRWSGTAARFSNGHLIYARGYGTRVRGAHPGWINCDDVLNDESMYSEPVRRKQSDYFFTAITNMIRPDGQICVVGTPFHRADLYGELQENKAYVWRRYRALGADGRPLWPQRYDAQRLAQRRDEIGPLRFTREFQCDPIADDMSLFPAALFRGASVEQPTMSLGMPAKIYEDLGMVLYMGVDIALSTSAQADYFVCWVMAVDNVGCRWIVEIVRERGIGFQEQLSWIMTLGRKYRPALIFIESNQMQRVWGDELIRRSDLPIKKFTTTAQNKHALDKGVPGLRVLLENAKFRIPRGDRRSVEMTDLWIDEMRSFTWANGKLASVAGHDDLVMGCWLCNSAVAAGGFKWAEEEKATDAELAAARREMQGEEEPVAGEASGSLIDVSPFGWY